MGLVKKIKKFFKKLGKQIKTNLKHGAKYIAPVLISALTGGFGSSIVQSLFGGKVAGALSNFGNKVFGGLLGKSSAGALPSSVTEGAKAVGEAVNSTGVPAVSTALGLAGDIAGGIPGISEITSQALSPVLGNSVTSGVLDAANTLVNKNAFVKGADKVLQNFTNTMALNGATGNVARKLYGEEALSGATNGGGGGSSSYADKLDFVSKLKPVMLGDEAKTVEVNPDNISLTEKKRFSSPTGEEQDEMRRIMQLAMRGDEKDKDKEDEEELNKYKFRQYVPMNYATGRRF